MAVSFGVLVPGRLALAQPPVDLSAPQSKPTLSRNKPASPNATINLVNLLVKQGVLTEQQAAELIKQAENEAFVAREAVKGAADKATVAEKTAADASRLVSPPGTKRVTYVPEIVKRQLREELKQEVMGKAKKEGWANPDIVPEWVNRIRFYGDVRVRYENDRFPPGNENTAVFYNFNSINNGSPFVFGTPQPLRNADENRNRFRLKARLGAEIDLTDGWSAGLRMGVGDSSSPVSTNTTLGGGGGNFSKYPIWLDRAYIRYQTINEHFTVSLGRFNNPFFAPTDLVWYDELGFDGVAAQVKYEAAPGFVPFAVAGAFPLYNTLFNFPDRGRPDQGEALAGTNLPSTDRYLFGGQIGFDWKMNEDVRLKVGAAYYDFHNVEGRLSSLCAPDSAAGFDVCDTDGTRPSFAQFGNTYMPLRNIIFGNAYQAQYFGLASPFRVVELTGRLDLGYFHPVHILVDGTYVKNIAFDWKSINAVSFNNNITTQAGTLVFNGGDTGAMGRVLVGHPKLQQAWDWNAYVAYKYLESDATVDAFTDPDFGLGGTNLRGYIVGANLGINKYVWSSVKWMSANSIAGPRFAVDVFQLDLNARF